ncbi:MAG: TonB family protein [Verrucomicrobiota bacterium]
MTRDPDSGTPHRIADFVAAAACVVALVVSAAGLVREAPTLREPPASETRPKPSFVKLDPTKLSAASSPAESASAAEASPVPAPAPLPPVASLPELRLPDLPSVPARRQISRPAAAVQKPAGAASAAATSASAVGTAASPAVLSVADVAGVQPWPEYPYECLRRRESGVVKVRFHVDPDGSVRHAHAADSSGCERLDEAAVGTILRQWRFAAGEVRHYEISIRFQLQ